MKIARIWFQSERSWFLLLNADGLPKEIRVTQEGCNVSGGHPAKRQFGLCHGGNALVKMKRQKYLPSENPLAWFFRVLIRDRLFFQIESRKERTGNKRLSRIGLKVAQNLGWGVSINPLNQWLCVYISAMVKAKTVCEAFKELEQRRRREILEHIADSLVKCVANGFVIKDPTLVNILVGEEGELIFVDTETKRVFSRRHAIRTLHRSLSNVSNHRSAKQDFQDEVLWLEELVFTKLEKLWASGTT